MLSFNCVLIIAFLSGALLLPAGRGQPDVSDIAVGFADLQTVTVTPTGGKQSPGIIVRVTNRSTRVQSFGLSNEAGFLVMPLPAGNYCYEAFSQDGHHLEMNRPETERCFEVKKGEDTEVGVGFKPIGSAPPRVLSVKAC